MTTESDIQPGPLPLWRAISGFFVFGILIGVLLLLAPSYIENYKLTSRVRAVVAAAKPLASEDELRAAVLAEARAMDAPVLPGDVKVGHPGGKLEVEVKYRVQKSLGPYQVDLHFHPSAKAE